MSKEVNLRQSGAIFIAYFAGFVLTWIFVATIAGWIINLVSLSLELNDVPGVSIGISIVAISVFVALASVLTYVFFGLHKEEKRLLKKLQEK